MTTPLPSGAVVVGVDYSPDSLAAAEYAAWEAQHRRAPLRVVHALAPSATMGGGYAVGTVIDAMQRDASRLLGEAVERVRASHPGLEVDQAVVSAGPAGALIAESEHAALIVVGARGSGGFAKLLLGSVAGQVAAHAHAPVIVVRGQSEGAVPAPGPVVVGTDGSDLAEAALAFAFDAAQARGADLVAVYAWNLLPQGNLAVADSWRFETEVAQHDADRILAEAVAGLAEKYPDVPVTRRAERADNPETLLLEAAAEAGLLVVASRGRGGFVGLLLGSVSRKLVAHAAGSVAVVHTR